MRQSPSYVMPGLNLIGNRTAPIEVHPDLCRWSWPQTTDNTDLFVTTARVNKELMRKDCVFVQSVTCFDDRQLGLCLKS